MSKDPLVHIRHIQDCVVQIMEYTSGMDQEDLLNNRLVQDAVIRNFQVIGEAAKHLNEDFRNEHPHVEWKKMAGMRDKLIHDYIAVDIWAVLGCGGEYHTRTSFSNSKNIRQSIVLANEYPCRFRL